MSIWKDNTVRQTPVPAPEMQPRIDPPAKPEIAFRPAAALASLPDHSAPIRESLIAADITIEGKIEGAGSVRIAGKFKGDVNVKGDLVIEAGAKLTGGVHADKVTIAGELEGNVEDASRVELLPTAVVVGDVRTRSLTVAAGARMRGQSEFGWDDSKGSKATKHGMEIATSS